MKNLGVFINNTDSELKLKVNLHNFNVLKENFTKIIIIDLENTYSENLKNLVKTQNHKLNNDYYKKDNIISNISKIKSMILEIKNIDYITFIDDNYIYVNNLKNYFNYIKEHNYDFYSYSDSTENFYHYEYYLFSIKYNFINSFTNNINELDKIFDKKISFLKIAYIPTNIEKNIFYNQELYKNLLDIELLPIIDINLLLNIKNKFKISVYNSIPDNFDINIYRSHSDLKDLSDDKLYNHFLNFGQHEFRKYSHNEYILPDYLRFQLKKCNLLNLFDLPDNFDIFRYIDDNKLNITTDSKKELIIDLIENKKLDN